MRIEFIKMHGLGNDFIMINNMNGDITLQESDVRLMCSRYTGIGADGVILVEGSEGADCFMNYINADGSFAEMCGNGIRCTAQFFRENISSEKTLLQIDTRSGIKEVLCHDDTTYSVAMGVPLFIHSDFPHEPVDIDGFTFECVSVGNPHAITFMDTIDSVDLSSVGPRVESDTHFPHKINVHFVEKLSDSELMMRVWERGSGATLACGTGAVGVYSLARKKGMIKDEATIHLPGGSLYMSSSENGEVIMRGPAETVFIGEIEI